MFSRPPYLPAVAQECGMTYGFSGSRSSTGGNELSMFGAWLYLPGLAIGVACEPTAPDPPLLSPPPPLGVLPLGEQAARATDPATTAEPYKNLRREMLPSSMGLTSR